ncbi:MAG: SurA N-terminal domain-containing protein [Deltaproteobacteria bacterium]|nr:SurA N-terminal domain-containing protein [Deltaproteobacteria bacterium]
MPPKPRARKKIVTWLLVLAAIAVILGLGTLVFQRYYHRQLWDPETAALVNGQPIYRSALEAMMMAGLNPKPGDPPRGAALTIRRNLDRLIIEELVRQEALKAGLTIPDAELANYLEAVKVSWPQPPGEINPLAGPRPEEPDLGRFLKAVRLRQQLDRLAQRVIPLEKRPTSLKWRTFWRDWLKKMPLSPVYRGRVLFVQATSEAKKLLDAVWKRDLAIEELEVQVRLGGFTTLLSRVMTINPLDQKVRAMFGGVSLREELAEAETKLPYLSRVFALPHSYAIVEVIAVQPAPEPAELAAAARKAFERELGREAFQKWVADKKRAAVIVINPNYPDLEEPSLDPNSPADPAGPASPADPANPAEKG